MKSRPTLGIIGHGSFGRFAAEKLSHYFDVKIYDKNRSQLVNLAKHCEAVSLITVAKQPIIILAINIDDYPTVLPQIAPYLKKGSLVIDVASVKLASLKHAQAYLPSKCQFLSTHPLFGPQSAQKLKGHTIVLCSQVLTQEKVLRFLKKLGLDVVIMDPREHDRQMAVVQGLTFFMARGLMNSEIHNHDLSTPSFKKLLALAELEAHHTEALFQTIQRYNPYAKAMRRRIIQQLQKLDRSIK